MKVLFLLCCPCLLWAVNSTDTNDNAIERRVLPEVTVWGERASKGSEPVSSELASERHSVSPERGVTSALRESTSIQVQTPVSQAEAPSLRIRGQDPTQNRVFLEGVSLTDAEFHGTQLALLPSSFVGEVEVYPGGVPALFGEDGYGGALQLRLWEGESNDVGTRAGSFGLRSGYARVVVSRAPSVRLAASYTQSDENFFFFDDNSTPFNPEDDQVRQRAHNGFLRVSLLPQVWLSRKGARRWRFFRSILILKKKFLDRRLIQFRGIIASFITLA